MGLVEGGGGAVDRSGPVSAWRSSGARVHGLTEGEGGRPGAPPAPGSAASASPLRRSPVGPVYVVHVDNNLTYRRQPTVANALHSRRSRGRGTCTYVAKPTARRAAAGRAKRSPAGSARDDCLPSKAIVPRTQAALPRSRDSSSDRDPTDVFAGGQELEHQQAVSSIASLAPALAATPPAG